ncbi:SpvB/TcaC N-terminal domain-containing protein [Nostoc sp. LEGE 12450]|uniref:SpvB/TcaC N-terminal domain-containing protein n=1 Tax=Nostoc sp. LEGE 12450 TaxID=1828643 RepID=UPI001882F48D|nr:SpvB/TcaC N-terminal domain-containing protein [Nostoc sp. LEGE 12450]MBE8989895.1 VCBS repeat-containing protein [Nostoc sp. LEGE 12450]
MLEHSNKNSNNQVDQTDKSYFSSPPAISLPKGGGAIKGMGEKFAANPVTGTGSVSVPISTTPGRSGFTPQLSLSYDSGAGNGVFGLGWNLSLSEITRKTDKGLPRYWDDEESDIFILSGAEDLVPVLELDGTLDETLRDGYRIRKYRPRIEGLFARIERWTNLEGETHWRSISKDNITTIYGRTAESRIFDPNEPTHVFSWLICESYDDKGNVILYKYNAENSEGVDIAQAHECNRTSESRSANRYLKRIKYGNLVSRLMQPDLAETDWLFEVVFDYGDHNPTNPKPNDPGVWSVRNDPFSSYRAGFEIRTYRLCQRVLMFHHFQDEANVGRDCLVRSLDFAYSYEQNPSNFRNPIYSLLLSVKQTGYKRNPEGGYIQKSLPSLQFSYSEANIDETVREVEPASLENLPQGLDGTRYQWVDLDGEGLSGILTEQGNGWFYKRNLSPINTVKTNGSEHIEARFAPVELVASKPAIALSNGAQFLDLAGDGQLDVVALRSPTPGFYERTHDENWKSFIAFKSLPNLDWDNPNLKFIDLDGDGHSDILITEDECFVWYPSLAEDGFGAAKRVHQAWDEEQGPRVVFADSTQSIHLADMSGDGLTDIVRIRNGEVCYWPNLGYGRFGAKVTMDNAPWFDAPDIFNQRRIVLADIDGSGTTDILYLSGKGVQVYFNQSGNSWAAKRTLRHFPAIDNVASVTIIDLLGNGTACLVWSSPLVGNAQRVMRYIDLMGGQKPHLLIKTVNNLGAETVVQYAPSTKFYLQDKLAGKPWITKLPFPVHVVERVETYDRISRNRFVTRHAYHHGYFDGVEREFRGFGMVEQWDTEEIGTIQPGEISSDSSNLDAASFVPPVHTKTWFHNGAYLDQDRISHLFIHEYYQGDALAALLPDTVLADGLTLEEEREACRSLKGSILRQEIYVDDGTDKSLHPYSVSEQNYTIELVQLTSANRHAVFFVHPRETIDYHYERNPVDPRVGHQLVLQVDEYGNVLKAVAIGYGRRQSLLSNPDDRIKQTQTLITYTENCVTNPVLEDDAYRTPLPYEACTYELTGHGYSESDLPKERIGQRPALINFLNTVQTAASLEYQMQPDGSLQKRLIERVRTLYRKNDLSDALPLGVLESLALPYESYKLAFTPDLLAQVYGDRVTEDILTEGGYLHSEGDSNWWIPSGRVFHHPEPGVSSAQELAFAQAHFFLPHRFEDPFNNVTTVEYDRYDLMVTTTRDAIGNEVKAEHDYRVMQPRVAIDPNQNRAQVAFDVLGMVAGAAVLGKVEAGESESGDSLQEFIADLSDEQVQGFLQQPRATAKQLLGNATTRTIYDLHRFQNSGQPVFAATIAREQHVNSANGMESPVQVTFSYSDGFGREVQTKVQAEPGNAPQRESNAENPDRPGKLILENGKPKLAPTNPRWVGNGRAVYNNKGKPVKQYEPFFSSTHLYEDEPEMVMAGVTPILFYDPAERVVATLHPNHTFEKVVFDPWQQTTWDVNDTVVIADLKTDADVGSFFERLPETEYLPTWYGLRIDPAKALEEWPDVDHQGRAHPENAHIRTAEASAARKAARHAGTPTIAHLDSLGRTFLTIADNGDAGNYETRVELDIEGNQRSVIDARGRTVMTYDYDLLGGQIHQASMEAGDRWMLNDVAGKPIRMRDSRNHVLRTTYDALQRPTQLFVKIGSDPEILAEQTIYGEGQGEATNHRGQIYQHFDSAGVATNEVFDFKGNLVSSTHKLVQDYKTIPDWSGNPALETEVFSSSSRYDALNRPIQLIAPHSNQPNTKLNVIRPGYNEANLLERMDVWLGEATEPTTLLDPPSANFHAVINIDHDAKGQRTLIEYGNGAKTEYTYDEKTFRLTHLKTTRGGAVLQDLFYTYDPVGNITRIRDNAQQAIFFKGQFVPPYCDYTYDPIYRLIEASGREHIGQAGQPEAKWDDEFRVNLPHPSNGQAMRNYTEQYVYDAVGNFEKLIHQAANGNWTRAYAYNEASLIEPGKQSNRLSSTKVGAKTEPYTYDAHGNMTSMPHLTLMQWDYKDELSATSRLAVNDTPPPNTVPETTFYVYNASGERVRKVTERQNGTRKHERIYLSGFELYRTFRSNGNDIKLEREMLHIMDDKQRIALVETKTITNPDDESPTQLIRFQLGNHLGSASLEVDDKANVISYEEYYPYGSTSYQAVDKSIKAAAKRYRYTGKERDEETGFSYHSARYCALWLGRWTSCDPIGISGGMNVYLYSGNNPLKFSDKTGNAPDPPTNSIDDIFTFIRNQAGFEAGAERGISLSSKAASPAGTAAHAKATGVLDALKQIGVKGAERIYSEVRTVGGIVNQIGGTPGGPKGSFNLDLVAVQEGKSLSVGDSLTSAVGEVVGDIKYGGGVISPKYNTLGIPLTTVNGNTVASTAEEVNALVSATKTEPLAAEAGNALVNAAKAEPLAAEAGAVGNLLAKAAPALSKLAPVAKALAPVAKFAGKVAGPLGIGIGVAQIATAKNTEGKIDGGVTAVSSALMMSKHPVAMAAGGGLMTGQFIEKTLDVSDYSSAVGMKADQAVAALGGGETARTVAGVTATILATPSSIGVAALDKVSGGRFAKWIGLK